MAFLTGRSEDGAKPSRSFGEQHRADHPSFE
jgi:hypothetical protein